jgi:hypothetical protein
LAIAVRLPFPSPRTSTVASLAEDLDRPGHLAIVSPLRTLPLPATFRQVPRFHGTPNMAFGCSGFAG